MEQFASRNRNRRLATSWIIAAALIWLFGSGVANAQVGTCESVTPQPISTACTLGKGLDNDRNLTIGGLACRVVKLDKSYTGAAAFKNIVILEKGALCVGDSDLAGQTFELQAQKISVVGTLQVGSKNQPIGKSNPNNKVQFTLLGSRPANPSPTDACLNANFNKGIEVCPGGVLTMFGAKGAPASGSARTDGARVSWTYLSAPAGPATYQADTTGKSAINVLAPVNNSDNANTIHVADNVSADWQVGDWIVIAGTSFSPFESEFNQIAAAPAPDGAGGYNIALTYPLIYYHFGGADPGPPSPTNYSVDSSKNYGVDERAEVGLISRNIKLTAQIPSDGASIHWGGEIIIRQGFQNVSIQGVELEKFGKDQLGSYPIHLHKDFVTGPLLINSNSIHHSYNKCVAVHSTSNVKIENTVCARAVGHLYYEEVGNENNITFNYNLGLGAMSNSFDINSGTDMTRDALIKAYWWTGDYLTNNSNSPAYNGYDGFLIPDTDNQQNGTTGACFSFIGGAGNNNSTLAITAEKPPCASGHIFLEPPSGFWLINPSAVLTGNSIGGCQGEGKGYWYVPPFRANQDNQGDHTNAKFIPVGNYSTLTGTHGAFTDNRVHGCDSGLYSGDQQDINAEALQPYLNGIKPSSHPVVAEFDGLTATRNRNRGAWLRPNFYVLKDARFAANRDSVSLVTSGGPDGNYPGIYSLLNDSVIVGISQNNVDRWGPCPAQVIGNGQNNQPSGQVRGGNWGCIDQTSAPSNQPPTGGDLIDYGYPPNSWNIFGYMIYDGPVLIFNDRFVNFKKDPTSLLTTIDQAYLAANTTPAGTPPPPHGIYEGDAALGWFQGNISSYPTGSASENLTFDNVDFRHQVYTQGVFISSFNDGDKNTAIIDLDGSLSGYQIVSSSDSSKAITDVHPISLNNLEINNAGGGDNGGPGGSVNECQATGAQDALVEGRATANFAPSEMGALEFEAQYPPDGDDATRFDQLITFQKDTAEFTGNLLNHYAMTLQGRNGQGVWEPKVTSGYGYTITAQQGCPAPHTCNTAGIPNLVHVGMVDVVKPRVSASNPFYVRVGICYTGNASSHPADNFTITRGYKSWGGGGVDPADPLVRQFYNQLDGVANGIPSKDFCYNLDHQNPNNLNFCPSDGITAVTYTPGCPGGTTVGSLCVYPKTTLTECPQGSTISCLTKTNNDGTVTPNLDQYFYDSTTGWLFLNVAQAEPNGTTANGGTAPLGSCTGDPAKDPFFCPSQTGKETYYVCPAKGCWSYAVKLNDPNYSPQPSACQNPYEGNPDYSQPAPKLEGQLAVANVPVTRSQDPGVNGSFPNYVPTSEPGNCTTPK